MGRMGFGPGLAHPAHAFRNADFVLPVSRYTMPGRVVVADTVNRLLEDRGLAARLGEGGRELAAVSIKAG